ncbi:VTT domain-containing protein [Nocardioides psychrotolerans]|uniref:VTT domain-containing protein n=1 Tax=Nocardioides psychrotolerans TaxID=1005945 RepID=UPI00313779E4
MIAFLTPLLYGLGPAALLLAMVIVFAETGLLVGFFLPGDSLLFTVGILVATGVIHLPLVLVAAGLFGAAAAGDQVGYLLGRRFGPRVFSRTESRLFSRSHAQRAETFFAKHGSKAVILARFVPVVRTFTPVVAGVARMPRRTFTVFNLAGAALWAVGLLVAGYFLGGVPIVAAHVELFTIGMVALSLVPAAAAVVRHRIAARHKADGDGVPVEPLEVLR